MTHIWYLFKPRSHCSLGQSYRGFANSWKVKLALKQENKAIVCSACRKMSNIYSHSIPRKMSQTEFFFKSFSHILFPFLRTQFSFPLQWKSCRHSSPGLEREIYNRSIFNHWFIIKQGTETAILSIFRGLPPTIKFKQKDLKRPPRLVVGGLVVVERVT